MGLKLHIKEAKLMKTDTATKLQNEDTVQFFRKWHAEWGGIIFPVTNN